jgi:branched-chain amino acid transport system substrate-binding protein
MAVLAAISACSSSSSSSASSPPATSSSPAPAASSPAASSSASGSAGAQASGSPLTIGVECSCSGPFGASVTAAWQATQAWSKWVNASGGVGGHPVVLKEMDDAGSPATALSNAQDLVGAKVPLIFDLSILDSAWEKVADAAKIPVVGGNISGAPYYTDPNFYASGQTNDNSIYSSFVTAQTAGAKNIGILNCAEGCTVFQGLEETTAKAMKLPIAYVASFAATAPNYTAQCLAAKQAGVQALFLAGSISVIARVASDCSSQGYDPVYVTEGTGFTNQVLTATGLKDHLWSEFPDLPYFAQSASITTMNAAIDQAFPKLRGDNLVWSEFAMEAWTGGLLIQEAAKAGGITASTAPTAAAFTTGLNDISKNDLGGLAPSLTFAAGKPNPVDCWYTAKVVGGVATQVGGETCKSAPASS